PECGFDANAVTGAEVADRLRAAIAQWPEVLERADVRERPTPSTWSALEYGCHTRDVFRVFIRRLNLMLEEDDPVFDNWDQDKTAVDDSYAEQRPEVVSEDLVAEGFTMAA